MHPAERQRKSRQCNAAERKSVSWRSSPADRKSIGAGVAKMGTWRSYNTRQLKFVTAQAEPQRVSNLLDPVFRRDGSRHDGDESIRLATQECRDVEVTGILWQIGGGGRR